MQTYNEETPSGSLLSHAERAGRFSVLANFFAGAADYEAAQRQRILHDPVELVKAHAVARQFDPQEPEEVAAAMIEAVAAVMLGDSDLWYERAAIGDVARELRYIATQREQRRAEDLDAPAAARSDERYDRKKDEDIPPDGLQEEWHDAWHGRETV